VLVAILLVLVRISAAVAAPAKAPVTVSGTVVDGTAGAKLPPNLTLTLQGVDASHQFSSAGTTAPDAQGHFAFPGVTLTSGVNYVVTTEYDGAAYAADVTVADGTPAPVTLSIYEPTTSDAALKLASASWVFGALDATSQQITVLEMFTLTNTGDHTYVGDHRGDPGSDAPGVQPRTIRITLPGGASDFSPLAGLDPSTVLPVANGYVDTAAVTPGDHQIVYSYKIAYADGVVEIQKPLSYPTDKLSFLVPDVGLQLRSDKLTSTSKVSMQGHTFVALSGTNLPANADVTVDVLGLPDPPTSRLSPDLMRILGLGIVVPLLAAAFTLGSRRGAPPRPRRVPAASDERALLTMIAALDDRYAAGAISAERYQQQRERRKRELIDLRLGNPAVGETSGSA
jgi:hypothetical protein